MGARCGCPSRRRQERQAGRPAQNIRRHDERLDTRRFVGDPHHPVPRCRVVAGGATKGQLRGRRVEVRRRRRQAVYADMATLGANVSRWTLVWDPTNPERSSRSSTARSCGRDRRRHHRVGVPRGLEHGRSAGFCSWLKGVAVRYVPAAVHHRQRGQRNAVLVSAAHTADPTPGRAYTHTSRCYDAQAVSTSIQVIGMGLAPRSVDATRRSRSPSCGPSGRSTSRTRRAAQADHGCDRGSSYRIRTSTRRRPRQREYGSDFWDPPARPRQAGRLGCLPRNSAGRPSTGCRSSSTSWLPDHDWQAAVPGTGSSAVVGEAASREYARESSGCSPATRRSATSCSSTDRRGSAQRRSNAGGGQSKDRISERRAQVRLRERQTRSGRLHRRSR